MGLKLRVNLYDQRVKIPGPSYGLWENLDGHIPVVSRSMDTITCVSPGPALTGDVDLFLTTSLVA